MHVERLGHVVLRVRSIPYAEGFYAGALGIPIISRTSTPPCMTFFTLGDHHDFAVVEIGDDAEAPTCKTIGLAHVAFKVGNSPEELRTVRSELDAAGIPILYETTRAFTDSLHIHDPDANEVELYVDTSDAWKRDVATLRA